MQNRILIVIEDGTLKGASITTDSGSPVPLSEADLALVMPDVTVAALAEIERLKTEHAVALAAAQGQPAPGDVSKLTLMRRLDALGKWGTFKTLLSQLPEIVQDAWTLAQSIRADDPLFVENAPTIKAYLGLTDEQFDALLE
jgi:hypothetical protein